MSQLKTLELLDVMEIHERLVDDAIESEDPISPPGVKNEGLLNSALSRQLVGMGDTLKYADPIENAATLCYGVCCNHAFHNGNKRTALVALMCHLDRNGYTFTDRASQDVLYSFMIRVANHSILPKKKKALYHDNSDAEVSEMASWIRRRTRRIEKSERSLSYPEFERVLRAHDVYFENHKNNTVDVVKYETVVTKKGWFGLKEVSAREAKKVANIPYFPSRTVGKKLVRSVRMQAGLSHDDGVDSTLFYGVEAKPDDFIQKYKRVLRRLAKT
ncbi:death-on-curing family protein [Tritonibacter multivorans]|uniref:Death-on-curing family protein n=1 Tax=Tritonibacter multivorans TaxID=928856 RepID=A0A0P1G745_9RHOB|nr:type II toxin-antitoxin system death-on-curing family toxin [Tritonibacter multivorans]MDA7421249.1 type II toxin-antitoxin system death-on-curing family toxin [Tritonibacter multivorans]CUH77422.1 death-on-curing family protein [Tritonibacter multivorans]SFD31841.1 death on curing protein [Tritonibacter multivorans]